MLNHFALLLMSFGNHGILCHEWKMSQNSCGSKAQAVFGTFGARWVKRVLCHPLSHTPIRVSGYSDRRWHSGAAKNRVSHIYAILRNRMRELHRREGVKYALCRAIYINI